MYKWLCIELCDTYNMYMYLYNMYMYLYTCTIIMAIQNAYLKISRII